MYKVYIWGCGKRYNRLSSYLNVYKNQIEVLGIISGVEEKFSYMDGLPIIKPDDIELTNVDFIIVSSTYWNEILNLIKQKNIDENYLIRAEVFENPWFDLEAYIKIKNSNITILSNYCLGGMIYKELGLKALSPTINMFCAGMDYIEFLKNTSYYLKCEMKEYIDEKYKDGTIGREQFYPKGIIDNKIIWNFNHSESAIEAIENWNRRAVRVNFDNIVSIMTIQSDEQAYAFDKLDIGKKIGFYYKDLGLDSIMYCEEWNDSKKQLECDGSWPSFANRIMLNSRSYVSRVNWIKFLADEKDYRRILK